MQDLDKVLVLLKATAIINKDEFNKKLKDRAYKAGICPTCGETLKVVYHQRKIIRRDRIMTKSFWKGVSFKTKTTWSKAYAKIFCVNDHKLTNHGGADVSEIKNMNCNDFEDTLNKEIKEALSHLYFQHDDGGGY